MRKFDSIEMFFRLQERWDRAVPYLLGFSTFFLIPAIAGWIEGR